MWYGVIATSVVCVLTWCVCEMCMFVCVCVCVRMGMRVTSLCAASFECTALMSPNKGETVNL